MTTQRGTAWVYIGTYTHTMPFVQGKAAGLAVYQLEYATGKLTHAHTVTGLVNPSYLTLDQEGRTLYCVEEYAVTVRETGDVSAFRVDAATGALTHLNRQPSHGAEPAHISMDRSGRWVLVANYRSGNFAVFPVEADGRLGTATDIVQHAGHSVHPERQQGPHAHWIRADPANRFLLVADLGIDAILIYGFDAEKGKLDVKGRFEAKTSSGSGPRHAVIRPDGRFVYLVNELDATIVSYRYDAAAGQLDQLQILPTLPAGYAGGRSIAAVRTTPDGRFVYASNRGHDSIAGFASNPETGLLEYLGFEPSQGRTPRDFNIDPTGTYLFVANQDSDTIVQFHIDQRTGKLNATGEVTAVDTPVCIEFFPSV
jgi:6-phosphogluconolactonase